MAKRATLEIERTGAPLWMETQNVAAPGEGVLF
jgi:hypothetical protein